MFVFRTSYFEVVAITYASLTSESLPDHYLGVRFKNTAGYGVLFLWLLMGGLIAYAYRY